MDQLRTGVWPVFTAESGAGREKVAAVLPWEGVFPGPAEIMTS